MMAKIGHHILGKISQIINQKVLEDCVDTINCASDKSNKSKNMNDISHFFSF